MDVSTLANILIALLLIGGIFFLLVKLKQKQFSVNARLFVFLIAAFMLLVSFWIVTNSSTDEGRRVGWIFFGANLLTCAYVAAEPVIAGLFKQAGESSAVITGRSLFIQSLSGVVMGVLLIVLSGFTGFTIAIPTVSFSLPGGSFLSALVTIFVAPLTEEPFFLVVVPGFLALVFGLIFGNRFLGLVAAIFFGSLIFSLFHWLAYGANLSLAAGAFVGAFVFRLLLLLVEAAKERRLSVNAGASTLAIAIPVHIIFNAYIYAQPLVITGVVG